MNKHALSRVLCWTCALALAAPVSAAVYRTVDEDGNVVYTDVPPNTDPAAARVIVSPVNTAELGTSTTAAPEAYAEDADDFAYEAADILSPADDEAVRANMGDVQVEIDIYPALQDNHEVQLFLDGKAVLAGRDMSYRLNDIDRGTHTLRVEIINADGRVVFAGMPSRFHLQRYAIPTAPNQVQPLPTPVNPPVNPPPRRPRP